MPDPKQDKKKEKKEQEVLVDLPSARDLIEAGVHWGHKTTYVQPENFFNIYGTRSGAHVINVYKSLDKLQKAIVFLKDIIIDKKAKVLFVATKPSINKRVKEFCLKINMPYVIESWIGGTFTNYEVIKKSLAKLKKLGKSFETGEVRKYPRHEQLNLKKEMDRLEIKFGGVKNMESLPAAVFIQDLKRDHIALDEAKDKKIPVIALADTNVESRGVDYPIPWNDDSIEGMDLFLKTLEKHLR